MSLSNIGKLLHCFTVHITLILQRVATATRKTGAKAGAKETVVVSQRTTGRTGTARGEGSGG